MIILIIQATGMMDYETSNAAMGTTVLILRHTSIKILKTAMFIH